MSAWVSAEQCQHITAQGKTERKRGDAGRTPRPRPRRLQERHPGLRGGGETRTDRAVPKDAACSASVAGASRVMRGRGQGLMTKAPARHTGPLALGGHDATAVCGGR